MADPATAPARAAAAPPPSLRRLLWEQLRRPVPPRWRGWLAWGWLLALLFAGQVVTGVLLSFYYEPAPAAAPESVKLIMRDVSWGWLIRGLHHWTSDVMIALGLLQMLRVLALGLHRGPGRSNWAIGLLLLLLLLLFAFTGRVLPWDADGYWSLFAALRRVESLPLVGAPLATLLRGGAEVAAPTLSRVWSAHALLLPWLAFFLLLLNAWLLLRRGRREPA